MELENLLDEIHDYTLEHEENWKNEFYPHGNVTTMIITQRNGVTYEVLIDTEDLRRVSEGRVWYIHNDSRTGTPYVRRNAEVNGQKYTELLHRFLTGAKKGQDVDHLYHDTLDNRKAYLKPCSHAENMRNRKAKNKLKK